MSREEKLEALNKLSKYGKTALHIGSLLGYNSIVKVLLDTAEEIDALQTVLIQEGKETPVALLLACQNGHADIVQIYLEKIKTLPNEDELILQEDIDGDTALHFAARKGHAKVVDALLENNHDSAIHKQMLQYTNNAGYTPLVTACKEGHLDILNIILTKAEQLNIKQHLMCLEYEAEELAEGGLVTKCTCLGFACLAGHTQIVMTLMNAAAACGILEKLLCLGVSPLLLALTYKHNDIIKAIIQTAEWCEYTLLSGPGNHWFPLHTACAERNLNVVDMVLTVAKSVGNETSWKDFICRKNENQSSVLHIACKLGHTEIAGRVLHFAEHVGVSNDLITLVDGHGLNCLHHACMSKNEECVQLLLNKADKFGVCKAVISKADDNGFTPLSYAYAQNKDYIISLLLEKANVLECCEDIFVQQDKKGLSVLHHACEGIDDKMVGLMIAKVIEAGKVKEVIVLQDKNKQSVLHHACNAGHKHIAKILLSKAYEQGIGKTLLFMTDENGQSALHCAAQKGFIPVVQLLLKYALDLGVRNAKQFICMRDCDGWTAMDLASQKDLEEVQNILMKKAERLKTLPKLCISHNAGTALHAACCGTSVNIVIRIIRSNTLSAKDLLLQQDEEGNTALSVACNRNKKLLVQKDGNNNEDIVDVLLAYAKQYNIAEELLCKENNEHQNALTLACLRADNYKTVRKVFQLAMELKLYKILDKTQIKSMPQFLVEEFDKLCDDVVLQIDEKKKADISDMSNLFVTQEKDQSFTEMKTTSLLTKIGDSGKEELITHQFTQFALALYWHKYARYLFFSFFTFYILFLVFFTCVMNNNYFLITNGTVTVINDDTQFDYSSSIITITLAIVHIIIEIWQLVNKRWYYLISYQNYMDLFVYLSALIVCIAMLLEDEHSWSHLLGTIALFAGWVNAAHILTIVPNMFGFRFVMLFSVLWNVVLFVPVLSIFIFAFALVFHNLIMNQEEFENIGNSIMKTMAMSIGELDFGNMFQSMLSPTPFEVVTHLMIAISLAIMTISVMNLLIGVAIGDIEEVKRTSKVRAFVTLSDLVLEYNSLFPWLVNRMWNSNLTKSHFVKLSLDVKAKELRKYDRRTKEQYNIQKKIEILSATTTDMYSKQNLTYESLEKQVKARLGEIKEDLSTRIIGLELQLTNILTKSDQMQHMLEKINERVE